ncbi:type II secretion system F family protein [Clostridium hydrogeniformans]|uniref:type II secretion system F family protein n=1 Tax=Clostridium hydrogeniformans TaxID=349933 RepID=UPI000480AB6A|nr:type II secretion system F family protein [Clostridium hydrogeniformans]
MQLILKGIVSACIFIIAYLILSNEKYKVINDDILNFIEYKHKNYFKKGIKSDYIKRKRNRLVVKIEELIKGAKVNNDICILNYFTFIIASFLCGLIIFILLRSFINNIFIQIEGIVLGGMTPFLILCKLSNINEQKIDDNMEVLITTGLAQAKTNNNLIYILKNTYEDMEEGPIKKVIRGLTNELEGGISVDRSFTNAMNKTSSIRFKELLYNLSQAREENGDYVQVFSDAEKAFSSYFKLKQEGIVEVKKANKAVMVLIGAMVATMIPCMAAFPNAKYIVLETLPGKLVVAYFGGVFISNLKFYIDSEKFKY